MLYTVMKYVLTLKKGAVLTLGQLRYVYSS